MANLELRAFYMTQILKVLWYGMNRSFRSYHNLVWILVESGPAISTYLYEEEFLNIIIRQIGVHFNYQFLQIYSNLQKPQSNI